jgi:hypothetical protein
MCETEVCLINQTRNLESTPILTKLPTSGGLASKPQVSTKLRPFSTLKNYTFLKFKGQLQKP